MFYLKNQFMEYPLLLYRGDSFNANFTYMSGLDINHCFLFMDKGTRILLVPKMHAALARKMFKGKIVIYKDFNTEFRKLLGKRRTAYADFRSLPASAYLKISKTCRLSDYSEELYKLRMKKTKHEVALLEKAARKTRNMIDSLDIRRGITEKQLKNHLLSGMLDTGLEQSFDPIVLSERNARFPHAESTNNRITNMALIDCGVKHKGYCGDITRCVFIRKDQKMQNTYEQLRQLCHSIVDAIPDMTTGHYVAAFAEKEMKRLKMPKLIHSIGHGIGLDVHEYPRLKEKSKDRIAGSVFTIEPGVYTKTFGLRFEEMVYFDGRKARIL